MQIRISADQLLRNRKVWTVPRDKPRRMLLQPDNRLRKALSSHPTVSQLKPPRETQLTMPHSSAALLDVAAYISQACSSSHDVGKSAFEMIKYKIIMMLEMLKETSVLFPLLASSISNGTLLPPRLGLKDAAYSTAVLGKKPSPPMIWVFHSLKPAT